MHWLKMRKAVEQILGKDQEFGFARAKLAMPLDLQVTAAAAFFCF